MAQIIKKEEQTRLFNETQGSAHLKAYLEPENLQLVIDNCVRVAETMSNGFDAIAFRGMSGSLVAPMVALRLKKNLIIVRKSVSDCHGSYLVEGHLKRQRYIIIDDLIASGKTVKAIKNNIKNKLNKDNVFVATILWAYAMPRIIYDGDVRFR